jgi:hypothetical protein
MKNHLSLLRIEELLFLAFSFTILLGTFQDHEEKNQYWKIHRQIHDPFLLSAPRPLRASGPDTVQRVPSSLTAVVYTTRSPSCAQATTTESWATKMLVYTAMVRDTPATSCAYVRSTNHTRVCPLPFCTHTYLSLLLQSRTSALQGLRSKAGCFPRSCLLYREGQSLCMLYRYAVQPIQTLRESNPFTG